MALWTMVPHKIFVSSSAYSCFAFPFAAIAYSHAA